MSLVVVVVHPDTRAMMDKGQLLDALRAASPQIAATLEGTVRDRTPERTGALREDESSRAYTGGGLSGNRRVNLVDLYCGTDYQEAEWHRVYWMYQEDEPVGLHTYTPQHAHMYARVETDDLGLIASWAHDAIESAAEELANAPVVSEVFGE